MSLDDLMLKMKARGNWGHKGRPGKRGGSISGVAGNAAPSFAQGGSPELKLTNHSKASDVADKISKSLGSGISWTKGTSANDVRGVSSKSIDELTKALHSTSNKWEPYHADKGMVIYRNSDLKMQSLIQEKPNGNEISISGAVW